MDMREYKNRIKNSQNKMKDLFCQYIESENDILKRSGAEEVSDICISLYEKNVYDCIELKIDTDAQTGFFTIAQSINPICHFWYFLESIVIGNEISYWHQDQEGPEAYLIVKKLNDVKIRVSLISEGWWEFNNNKKGLKKIYNDKYQLALDMICSKREFITKIYAVMMSINYPIPDSENDYDPWGDSPKDSDIINEYVSGLDNSKVTYEV